MKRHPEGTGQRRALKMSDQNQISAKDKDIIAALRLFNEKANKLEGLSFTKNIFGEESGFRISGEDGQFFTARRFGPDDESIDAFVLTFRLFLQNNEVISFENMAKLYATLSINTDLIQRFNEARNKINEFLDKPSPIKIGDKENTNRYMLEVFLWGGRAHANKDKKLVYDNWQAQPVLFPMLEHEFVGAIATVLKAILYMRAVNEEALAQITLDI